MSLGTPVMCRPVSLLPLIFEHKTFKLFFLGNLFPARKHAPNDVASFPSAYSCVPPEPKDSEVFLHLGRASM